MAEKRSGKANFIATVVVLGLLAGCGLATLLMWWLGDWEQHAWGLTLALRIIWGCYLVVLLATILTRVTLFAWSFRRYLRWPEGLTPEALSLPRRPTRAPWPKSAKASFAVAVVLVSITGAAAVATAVMWILEGVTGTWVFTLVTQIIWASWWVLCVAAVVTRVAIFSTHKNKATVAAEPEPEPAAVASEPGEQGPPPGSAT